MEERPAYKVEEDLKKIGIVLKINVSKTAGEVSNGTRVPSGGGFVQS